jgi:peptide/nickel transport system substrate-binding protein
MPEHAQKISRFVADALEAVGFTVTIELETNRPEYARSIGLRTHVGDLALFDSTPNTTFRVLDDKVSSANNATWWLGYHDEEFQELFARARTELTENDRGEAYAACLRRVQQNPPWLYVHMWYGRPSQA